MLAEEKRRIECTLEWKAVWWEDRSVAWDGVDPVLLEGVQAYATEQAAVQRKLKGHFLELWEKPRRITTKRRGSEERPEDDIDPAVEVVAADGSDDDE